MYFGSDEDLAGAAAGERTVAAGAKHPLCVIQAEGSVALEPVVRASSRLLLAPRTSRSTVLLTTRSYPL